jgi:hypothetical protein
MTARPPEIEMPSSQRFLGKTITYPSFSGLDPSYHGTAGVIYQNHGGYLARRKVNGLSFASQAATTLAFNRTKRSKKGFQWYSDLFLQIFFLKSLLSPQRDSAIEMLEANP